MLLNNFVRTVLQILRLLANEETSTEEVDLLRDSLDYYLQSHQVCTIAGARSSISTKI